MDTGLASVLAAAVTGGFAFLGVMLNRARKENKDDHEYVAGLLSMLHKSTTRIENRVNRVDERLSDHLEFHAERGVLDNGRFIDQNGSQGNP